MCLKADKIDEGHRAITLKKSVPALDFENNLHASNLSKCKQSQLSLSLTEFTSHKIQANCKKEKNSTSYNSETSNQSSIGVLLLYKCQKYSAK